MRLHEQVGGVPIRQGEQRRLAVNKRSLAPHERKNTELVGLLLLLLRPRIPCEEVVFQVNCSSLLSRIGPPPSSSRKKRLCSAEAWFGGGIIPARQKAPNQNTPVDARQRIPDICSPPTSPIPTLEQFTYRRTLHRSIRPDRTHIELLERVLAFGVFAWENPCCWATKGLLSIQPSLQPSSQPEETAAHRWIRDSKQADSA